MKRGHGGDRIKQLNCQAFRCCHRRSTVVRDLNDRQTTYPGTFDPLFRSVVEAHPQVDDEYPFFPSNILY